MKKHVNEKRGSEIGRFIRIAGFVLLAAPVVLLNMNGDGWAIDNYNYFVTVSVRGDAPVTTDDYDGTWHKTDFYIKLAAAPQSSKLKEIYYKLNNGDTRSVNEDGFPFITEEGSDNILEYWGVDVDGEEEVPHHILSGIKLDKTAPTLNLIYPCDEDYYEVEYIDVTAEAEDELSGIMRAQVSTRYASYIGIPPAGGLFTFRDVPLDGGPNTLVVVVLDNATNYTYVKITIYSGWMLHIETPYYEVGEYDSGAACCQMILNYIRQGWGPELTQKEIYEYGHQFNLEENASLEEMDPWAIKYALGWFDPYDPKTTKYYQCGNSKVGYSFDVRAFLPDMFEEYLRDIVHWMAYPVVRNAWEEDAPLVRRPYVPTVVPVFGTYEHWIIVNGAVASENPAPEPRTNPHYTPDFTVYGLWLTDPATGGIGRDIYVTAEAVEGTYFMPVDTTDRYRGRFVRVAEPPDVESDAEIEIAPQVLNTETDKVAYIASRVAEGIENNNSYYAELSGIERVKRHIYDAALTVDLKKDPVRSNMTSVDVGEAALIDSVFGIGGCQPIEIDWSQVVDPALITDDSFRNAFNKSQARSFYKVKRPDKENFYYLVPFDKYICGQFLTFCAVIIDGETGAFQEASWVRSPVRFVQINGDEARRIVALDRRLLYDETWPAELVWEPGGPSESPFYPYWKVTIGNKVYAVTQEGKVICE